MNEDDVDTSPTLLNEITLVLYNLKVKFQTLWEANDDDNVTRKHIVVKQGDKMH